MASLVSRRLLVRPLSAITTLKRSLSSAGAGPQAAPQAANGASKSSSPLGGNIDGMTCAGSLSKEHMEAVICSKKFKSWIYLCTDEGNDTGLDPEGTAMLQSAAIDETLDLVHLPLDIDRLTIMDAYSVFNTGTCPWP